MRGPFRGLTLTLLTEILQLKTLKGLALQDVLTEVHLLLHRGQPPVSTTENLFVGLCLS